MDLTPFKLDADELLDEFTEGNYTTLADMKRVWMAKKFSYIYEAKPTSNEAFFMQSLYSYSILMNVYMVSTGALLRRLGGLYCLYCLYETQPYKPAFKIYYLFYFKMRKLRVKELSVNRTICFLSIKPIMKWELYAGCCHYNYLNPFGILTKYLSPLKYSSTSIFQCDTMFILENF
ncbi:unnamed protein product [Musa hybrid cultivar]